MVHDSVLNLRALALRAEAQDLRSKLRYEIRHLITCCELQCKIPAVVVAPMGLVVVAHVRLVGLSLCEWWNGARPSNKAKCHG